MKRQPAALILHLPRQGHRQGNSNPIYHAIARSQYGPYGNKACDTFATGGPAWNCTFNDVTVGDDDMDCTGPYNCYDPRWSRGPFFVRPRAVLHKLPLMNCASTRKLRR